MTMHKWQMASQRSVGSGMLPPLLGRQTSRRRLVSKRAIQERDDFHILLFAAFFLCFNSGGWEHDWALWGVSVGNLLENRTREPHTYIHTQINTGFVNVITLSSYLELASTHVTGLVAKTSIAIGDADWRYLYLPSTTFLCFLLGATAGGVCIRYETFYLGRGYGRSLIFIALLIGLALLIDKMHAPASTSYHYYVYMCAVAAGKRDSENFGGLHRSMEFRLIASPFTLLTPTTHRPAEQSDQQIQRQHHPYHTSGKDTYGVLSFFPFFLSCLRFFTVFLLLVLVLLLLILFDRRVPPQTSASRSAT